MTASVYTERYIKFRKLLVAYRKKAGLTQKELGKLIGKHQSDVSKYERGVRRLDVVEMIAIAEALDVDPHGIITKIHDVKS